MLQKPTLTKHPPLKNFKHLPALHHPLVKMEKRVPSKIARTRVSILYYICSPKNKQTENLKTVNELAKCLIAASQSTSPS